MTESSGAKITAFHGIFETKLKGLLKDIKKLRKDPTKKDRLKNVIQEAKQLKKLLKVEKENKVNPVIEIPIEVVDGEILVYSNDIVTTMGVKVVSARIVNVVNPTTNSSVLEIELETK